MKNILPSIALALIAGLTGSQAADNVTTSNTTSTSTTSSSGLGYGNITSTLPSNSTFSFGSRYAILNLDLINGIVGSFNTTPAGQAFINSTSQWIDAVQSKSNSSSGSYDPLTIYTRIYFSTLQRPELGLGVPFSNIAQGFGNITESSETGELYPAFAEKVLDTDVVLQKTRFYAGAGNGLEEILRANKIDTVVLSGVRTSGVILTTAIRLYDLDYNVYIISDNVIETPPDNGINTSILEEIFPKFVGMQVISLEQAKGALERS